MAAAFRLRAHAPPRLPTLVKHRNGRRNCFLAQAAPEQPQQQQESHLLRNLEDRRLMLEALAPQKAVKAAVAPHLRISIGDSMGAATAFRSCEAAGAPMPAFYRAVLLMRRELLKWALAPFSTSGGAASLDAARGAALCAQLCQTHPLASPLSDGGDRAIFRRLQRPVQQALQALLGAWRPPVFRQHHLQTWPNIAERQEVLRLVAAIDEGFGRELLAELRIVAATQASLPWIKRALVALSFALRSFGGADGRKRLPEAPSSPLGSVWLEGELRGRDFEVSFPGQLESRAIPTSMRELAGRAARG
eukprot:s2657_g9.t1